MKNLLFLLLPFLGMSQVGINTQTPTETLDVSGTLRVREITEGTLDDSILVVDASGVVKKITLSSLLPNSSKCPDFVRKASSGHYLLFSSESSVNKPNDALTIKETRFVSAGTWIENNTYYYSYTNAFGKPIDINEFTVNFSGQICKYKK